MRRKDKDLLTPKEQKFVAAFTGNYTEAAKAAGYRNPRPAGSKVASRPHVAKALQAKQQTVVAESGKQLGRVLAVHRNDIIMGLADEARDPENHGSTRVSAWSKLADIFGLSPKNDRDKERSFFDGWTDEEIDYFIANDGTLPLRFRAEAGSGGSGQNPAGEKPGPSNSDR
jgi:hypothetical protein